MRFTRSSRAAPARMISAVGTVAGLLTGVAGTFLPWLRSGSVYRDSYQTAAAVEHLDMLSDPVIETALRCWTGVPFLVAGCSALFAFGRPRTAAAAALTFATIVGTVSVLLLVQGGDTDGLIAVATTGPAITVVGMAIATVGSLGVFVTSASSRTRTARTTEEQV